MRRWTTSPGRIGTALSRASKFREITPSFAIRLMLGNAHRSSSKGRAGNGAWTLPCSRRRSGSAGTTLGGWIPALVIPMTSPSMIGFSMQTVFRLENVDSLESYRSAPQFCALLLLAFLAPSGASAQSEVSGVPIRFDGVAAPDLDEPYGEQSKNAMRGLVAGQQVRCELTGAKTCDRFVGTCLLEDGRNLSAEIISMGLARDCPRYSGGRYKRFETERSRRLPFPAYCKPTVSSYA